MDAGPALGPGFGLGGYTRGGGLRWACIRRGQGSLAGRRMGMGAGGCSRGGRRIGGGRLRYEVRVEMKMRVKGAMTMVMAVTVRSNQRESRA